MISGCGGDDGNGTTSQLNKAEFLKQANAACRKEKAALGEEVATFLKQRGSGEKPGPAMYQDLTSLVLLPEIERETYRIGALRTTLEVENRTRKILAAQQIALDKVVNASRLPSIAAVYRGFEGSGDMLRAYGLPSCANGPRPPSGVLQATGS